MVKKAGLKFVKENLDNLNIYAAGQQRYQKVEILATDVPVQKLVPTRYGHMAVVDGVDPIVNGKMLPIHRERDRWISEGTMCTLGVFVCMEDFKTDDGAVVPKGRIQIRAMEA